MYTYYKYVSVFHVEPKDWRSLIEYFDYTNIESKILALSKEFSKGGE